VAQRISTSRPAPGKQPLSREFIAQHQRTRIINALAEEVAAKGYRAVTVADIVRRAGIARNTFYDNFSSKEDCFLAAQRYGAEALAERILEASDGVEGWPQRVEAGMMACLRTLAGSPALARLCIVDALSAGPAATERYEQSLQAFVPFFRIGRQVSAHGRKLPDTLEEAVVGGVFWIVYQRIVAGEAEQLEEIGPQLLEFVMTPYLGPEAARRTASGEAAPDA
jgi:AcrR family transcriptional regulator